MGHRGRERLVKCEQCGRFVRRDKAVFIEKTIFSNPLERKDVTEPSAYKRAFTREVAYCPGCGKHLRVYEKKQRQMQRARERRLFGERRFERPRPHPRPEEIYGGERKETEAQEAAAEGEGAQAPEATESSEGAESGKNVETA